MIHMEKKLFMQEDTYPWTSSLAEKRKPVKVAESREDTRPKGPFPRDLSYPVQLLKSQVQGPAREGMERTWKLAASVSNSFQLHSFFPPV